MTTARSTADLHADAVRLLSEYRHAPEEARTPILKAVAEVLVEARGLFLRDDGTPDLLGKSYPYRNYVTKIYADSGIQRPDLAKVQAAVRYHVSAAVRTKYDRETLETYGLDVADGREKSKSRRANRSALLSSLTAKDLHGGALLAISAAHTVLAKVNPDDLDDLDGDARAVATAALADVGATAERLQRRIDAGEGAA